MTLGAPLLYSAAHDVSQWAQCFFDLFPHFSGVSLFILVVEMPGYNQPLPSITLFPPPHCSCLWVSSGPCLVFTCGPYMTCIALVQAGQDQELLRGRESRQAGLPWNSKKSLGKDSNDTV